MRRHACCTGQELVVIAPYNLSQCVLPGRERIGNPLYPESCWIYLREGRERFQYSVSLSHSLLLLNLLTSSQSSVSKQRSSSVHTSQWCAHDWHPVLVSELGTPCNLTLRYHCVPPSALSGKLHWLWWVQSSEAVAFCQVDTISPWLSLQSFSALPVSPNM